MANDRLVGKILDACERFERGDLSVAELQAALEINAWALMGVDKSVRSKLREFSNDLENIQFASPLETRYQATCVVIKELRAYLRSALP